MVWIALARASVTGSHMLRRSRCQISRLTKGLLLAARAALAMPRAPAGSRTTGAAAEALDGHAHRSPDGHRHGSERAERLLDRHAAKMREEQLVSSGRREPIAKDHVIA